MELFWLGALASVEPATTVALSGDEHGYFNQYSDYVSRNRSGALSHQHVADRRTRKTDRARHRHYHRNSVAAEIPGGLLAALKRDAAQSQRIANDADGRQRHRRCGDDRR